MKAASVLPEPVGAEISVVSPARMCGQPCSCGSVGWPKRARNHSRTIGCAQSILDVATGFECAMLIEKPNAQSDRDVNRSKCRDQREDIRITPNVFRNHALAKVGGALIWARIYLTSQIHGARLSSYASAPYPRTNKGLLPTRC